MTDVVKVDQTQLMEALAAIVGQQRVQEIQGTIVGGRADAILEEAEEHYADVLLNHGLAYTDDGFDETVHRLERIRALRAGENAGRHAQRHKRR